MRSSKPSTKKRASVKHEDTTKSRITRRISKDTYACEMLACSKEPYPYLHLPSHSQVNAIVSSLLESDKVGKALDTLLKLDLEKNSKARDEFKSTNICQNLAQAMKQSSNSVSAEWKSCHLINDSVNIQWKCARLVTNFTHQDVGHFTSGFLSAGAAELIIKAMKKFPRHKKLQIQGCAALTNLSCHVKEPGSKKGVKHMVEGGLIGAVLGAMTGHEQCNRVQYNACACLKYIVAQYPCATELMKNNCIESVLVAMEAHFDDANVQSQACSFLASLAESNPEAPGRIKEKGGAMAAAKAEHFFRGKDDDVHGSAEELLKCLFS
jgi:hypothetical protein